MRVVAEVSMNNTITRANIFVCLHLVLSLIASICTALDPWPTINNSPLYSRSIPNTGTPIDNNSCHCKFFFWDFISFIKYRRTNNFVKQNTYEGLSGRKFIRVHPAGSVYEKWLPQLRNGILKKDACSLCGYSFTDHLEFWTQCQQRRRYSTLDSYLDSALSKVDGKTSTGFSFHRQYVEEANQTQKKHIRKGKVMRYSGVENISYLVSAFNPLADSDGKPKKLWSIFMLLFARTASLERMDDLIWFESSDRIESTV